MRWSCVAMAVVLAGCPLVEATGDFACKSDSDCLAGEVCHPVSSTCRAPCDEGVPCPDGAICEGDRCVAGVEPPVSSSSSAASSSSSVGSSSSFASSFTSSSRGSSSTESSSSSSAMESSSSSLQSSSSEMGSSSSAVESSSSSEMGASSSMGCRWYADVDGDGYAGLPEHTECPIPTEAFFTAEDCDDANKEISPAAVEACNDVDDNCNNATDEGLMTTWYRDEDGDGFGTPAFTVTSCAQPAGHVANALDCDDRNTGVRPGAMEVCGNALDDNCDGVQDGPLAEPWSALSYPVNYVLVGYGGLENTSWAMVWTNPYAAEGSWLRNNGNAHNSSWSLRTFTARNGTGPGYAVQQMFAVTPGTPYVFSAFFHTAGVTTGGVRLDMFPTYPGVRVIAPVGETRGWQFGSAEFTPGPGITMVSVRVVRDGDRTPMDAAYVDNVGITPRSQFNLPTRTCGPVTFTP